MWGLIIILIVNQAGGETLWRYLLSSEKELFSNKTEFLQTYQTAIFENQIKYHPANRDYTLGLGFGEYNFGGVGDMDVYKDTIYINNNGQDNVRKFTSTAQFIAYFGNRVSLYYIWGMAVNSNYIALSRAGGLTHGGNRTQLILSNKFNPEIRTQRELRDAKISRMEMDENFIYGIRNYSYNALYGDLIIYSIPDLQQVDSIKSGSFYAVTHDNGFLYLIKGNRKIVKYQKNNGHPQPVDSIEINIPGLNLVDISTSENEFYEYIFAIGVKNTFHSSRIHIDSLMFLVFRKNNLQFLDMGFVDKRLHAGYFYHFHLNNVLDTVYIKSIDISEYDILSDIYNVANEEMLKDSVFLEQLSNINAQARGIVEKYRLVRINGNFYLEEILEFGERPTEKVYSPFTGPASPYWVNTNTYGLSYLVVRKPGGEIYKILNTKKLRNGLPCQTYGIYGDWKKNVLYIGTGLNVFSDNGVFKTDTSLNIIAQFTPFSYGAHLFKVWKDSLVILQSGYGRIYVLKANDLSLIRSFDPDGADVYTNAGIEVVSNGWIFIPYNRKSGNGWEKASSIRIYDFEGNLIKEIGKVERKLFYYTIAVDDISFPWKIYTAPHPSTVPFGQETFYIFEFNPYTFEFKKVDSMFSNGYVHPFWTWDDGISDNYHKSGEIVNLPNPNVINGKVFISDLFNQRPLIYLPEYKMKSDDSLSLYTNNNIHFKRNRFKNEFYVVYSSQRRILFHTIYPDGMISPPEVIGKGYFPALALDHEGNPVVIWYSPGTPENNYRDIGLWFRRMVEPGVWLEPVQLMSWWNYWSPAPTSPPSMIITSHQVGNEIVDTVHILINLYVTANGRKNAIAEISFPLDFSDPSQFTIREIVNKTGLIPNKLEYPSIAYTEPLGVYPGVLHAVWQNVDTVYYAYRLVGSNEWIVKGDIFSYDDPLHPGYYDIGFNSSKPFIYTEGDKIYVVWSHRMGINELEEVWRISGHPWEDFSQWNRDTISQTIETHRSLYPVITDQQYTFYVEQIWPRIDGTRSDVFWRRSPAEPAYNISNDFSISSLYPDAEVRSTRRGTYLYVIWQEGNEMPYEIKFKKIFLPAPEPGPVFSYTGGSETPAPYLIYRDTFITDWEYPVDVGYENLKYQFNLKLGYEYKLRVVLYHESGAGVFSGHHDEEWKVKMKIDGKKAKMIEYEANEPETMDVWIPEPYYRDGKVEISFQRKKGNFVSLSGIYIYRFEYEEEEEGGESGPQAMYNKKEISFILPTFIKGNKIKLLNIPYKKPEIEVFDVSGRRILKNRIENGGGVYLNKGSGAYILIIRDRETGKSIKRKIIKLE